MSELLEVKIVDKNFNKVRETLTRMGIASTKDGEKRLIQSCHILKMDGKYYITHFKELFFLDGQDYSMSLEDIHRRNKIAIMLESWGLVEICSNIPRDSGFIKFTVVSAKDKCNWKLVHKYTLYRKQF